MNREGYFYEANQSPYKKKKSLGEIIDIVALVISIVSLIVSIIAYKITTQGGDIEISTHYKEGSSKNEFINDEISINLKQYPDIEPEYIENNLLFCKQRLEYESHPMVAMGNNYLYINNIGKFSENDLIIQFESEGIYFTPGDIDDKIDMVEYNESIEKYTNYEFQLVNYEEKAGYKAFRMKINPGENIYPGLVEKINLHDIFNEEVAWFYVGDSGGTVPVNVTIASGKFKPKTFTINLNITKSEG